MNNTRKLLVICGPTATSKTKIALKLASIFKGQIISADSRQVYKYMDIGTGKTLPLSTKILGYNLVLPNEEFSVSKYLKFAENTIKKITEQKKLPILVGGTGLYIKAIVDGIESINIPPNKKLRSIYVNTPANELFKILEKLNSQKALSMNDSDKKNPRRLMRAIEISSQTSKHQNIKTSKDYDLLMIGLTTNLEELQKRINERVDERVKLGFVSEVKFLKENNFWQGAPSKTLGYKNWPDIKRCKIEEFKYAKRQIVWFKKEKRINWVDITKKGFEKEIEKLVQKWYS